jgi:hypothetical protein
LQWYWRADFVNDLSDAAIAQHVKHGSAMPTMHLYPVNGAAGRVGKTDTPWSYRDANWAQVTVGVDPDPANKEKITAWSKAYSDALHPHSAGGGALQSRDPGVLSAVGGDGQSQEAGAGGLHAQVDRDPQRHLETPHGLESQSRPPNLKINTVAGHRALFCLARGRPESLSSSVSRFHTPEGVG